MRWKHVFLYETGDVLCQLLIGFFPVGFKPDPLLMLVVRAALVILIFIGIFVYFVWKKKKNQKAEGSAAPDYENSVMMVEMRNSDAFTR